ncbi:DUF1295 domain-containing protein [Streptomyces sp. G-5]|uniref:DUF1295 domain-containing protein n=1 Tax=Streptomyces sp. G-5 TaxID=2977231 RepID=UPI0021D3321F|nr:DUF1295 domain-containing protein [Streptomyces sp. G-5]MCU4746249.1 DUF1295 domain-containing protein [Streptomyces sp. G-5]
MSGLPWVDLARNAALSAVVLLVLMAATFAVAMAKGGLHRVVDSAWGLGFAALAVAGWIASTGQGDDAHRLLVAVLTAVWGLRLAAHIAWRGRGHGEDPRYARMLDKAPGNRHVYALRKVYLLQGVLILLVSAPVQIALYAGAPPLPLTVAAIALWALGMFFEAVGDRQLARFRADPANRGRLMDRGLWSWTRHPNYFGDFAVWWGLYLLACSGWTAALVALPAPLVMSALLIFGSGKALLERRMADRPGWAAYAARTSGFFPRPPRRPRAPADG